MQRIIRVLDALTIASSVALTHTNVCSILQSVWSPADIVNVLLWFVLLPLSIVIRTCFFANQRWQLVADRVVTSAFALGCTYILLSGVVEVLSGSTIDLEPATGYLFGLIVLVSVVAVKGTTSTAVRVLLSVLVLPMFLPPLILSPAVGSVCFLTSALGCIWREHRTTHPIQI
jgi:hypothetical protein